MTIWAEDDTSTGSRFTSIAHIISSVVPCYPSICAESFCLKLNSRQMANYTDYIHIRELFYLPKGFYFCPSILHSSATHDSFVWQRRLSHFSW